MKAKVKQFHFTLTFNLSVDEKTWLSIECWTKDREVFCSVLKMLAYCIYSSNKRLHIGLVNRVFANDPRAWVQSQVASYQIFKKWYLVPPCLTHSNIRYVSKVKWSNLGKGVAPSPTPWCSSYRKRSHLVALNYGRELYYLLMKWTNPHS